LALDHSLEDTVPFLLAPLGITDPAAPMDNMDPQIRRRRILSAIQRLVLREARRQPVLMVIEDLHWLDSETQNFLTMFGAAVASAPILLLVNYRPEYQPTWDAATSHTQLRLNAFGREDAETLLLDLLGDDPALHQLKHLIIDKTQGNPFFMEEYVRTLFDQGILKRGDKIELMLIPANIDMPATVQGVVAARIDRLPSEHKEFLQMLSVLGMAFPARLIERMAERPEAELQDMLDQLQGAEFLYERPAFPDVEYVFKHALTREAAYSQLLLESRRALHARAAQAIEAHFNGDRLHDYYSELAHHYSCSDNLPKAVEFLQRAALQAMQRSAYAAAVDHVTSALTMLPGLPGEAARDACELQLQSTLGAAWMATRGFAVPEISDAYGRARDLCRDTTDSADLIRALAGLGLLYINRGELRLACDIGEQLLGLAERRQETELFVSGHELLGLALLRTGDLSDSRSHMERAIRRYDDEGDGALHYRLGRDPTVTCLGFGAFALWLLGYPDQAVAGVAQALRAAHAITPRHPFSLAYAMLSSAWVHQFRGEASLALQEANAAIEFANEQGFPAWLPHGQIIAGWAEVELGQTEKGVAHIEQALLAYQATGAVVWQPLFLLVQARALTLMGKIREALQLITSALRFATDMGTYWWEAELLRVKGELLLALDEDNAAEAETHFARAMAIAKKQSAKSLELRACVSMARLARRKGDAAQAVAELAALCDWFTEGLNAAELLKARELIKDSAQG
jgi:predicted ATPase